MRDPARNRENGARIFDWVAEGKLKPRRRKCSLMERLLGTPPGRAVVFKQARKSVIAKTRGLYPAPLNILECVQAGFSGGEKAGYERESVLFGRLTASPEAKSLIGLFEAMTELKKPLEDIKPHPVRRLAVLGGGFMGQGIASVSLPLAEVVVRDVSQESLKRCAKGVYGGLGKQVKSGAINRFDLDRLWAKLLLTDEADDLKGADLVIEAVFEDLTLKQRVLAEAEERISETAVLASNTSALPIASIGEKALHPERILGMHYFSPVPKMPLLEMIVTDKTAPWAVATARAFAVSQGKTVIVVKDGPGFYTTRILSPYLNEAMTLLAEGASVELVDRAAKDFGYPVGPIALLDEVGIDIGAHVVKEFGPLYAHRGLGASDALPRMNDAGYAGRKNGRGFYVYPAGRKKGKKRVNREVYAFFGGEARKTMDPVEVAERMAFLMVNEAAYCLQEEVLSSPRDGDVGAILGLGFPPFRGGPFRYADASVPSSLVSRMEAFAERFGPRFAPAPILKDLAKGGGRFYSAGG